MSEEERWHRRSGSNSLCRMDLVPAPSGETSLKSPLVEVEAVDTPADVDVDAEQEDVSSDFEADSDDSEAWETLSHGGGEEGTIQLLRDDQLRDGLGMYQSDTPAILPKQNLPWANMFVATTVPGACTLEEAIAYRNRLHAIGKTAFVEETIVRETVTAKTLCTAFGIFPPAFLEGAPDEAFHPLLAVAISREFSRRPKLPQYNTIDDAVKLLRESKNIIVLTGAGVCVVLFWACTMLMFFFFFSILDLDKPRYSRLSL